MNSIINFSIKNKLIIGLCTLGLIVWGLYSVINLPIDAVPDITNNQVQIITLSPSLAAQEVERTITFPIEQSLAVIARVEEMRSISRFGLSVVTLVFPDDADIYWARQAVSDKLGEAKMVIPPGSGTPELAPITTGLGEIYQYVLHPTPNAKKDYSPQELRTIQDWVIRRQLLGTPGIADVSSFGGELKQYEVAINPDKLRSFGISLNEIFDALSKNNQNTGGAYIEKQPNAYFIRSEGLISSIQDIEQILVKTTENGIPVLIKNVADVHLGHATRYGSLTYNDKEVVGSVVLMLKGENSSAVVQSVKERIAQIQKTLPEDLVIEPYLDRSSLVKSTISTVEKNLIEGALIVIFVLVLFLGNIRAGLIVASVIPLAMLFAVSMMRVFGVSGNLMSLGAIDFGLIVDGAVIIVEATMHHLFIKPNRVLTQSEMNDEVFHSAKTMLNTAIFGEIIILIVYLPLLALVGVEGKMFRPMAQTVSFAIIGAFILSLTYVPAVTALFLSKKIVQKETIADKMMHYIQKIYHPSLEIAIRFRYLVVAISFFVFLVSILLFTRLGGEFLPTLDEGDFAVETRLLPGSSLTETIDKTQKAAQILRSRFPEVKQVVGKIGSAEIPIDPMPVESCDLIVMLKPKSEWTSASTREELAEKMQDALSDIVGVSFSFQQPIQMRFNELMAGVRQDIGIKIFGENLDTLADVAKRIGALSAQISGASDLYVEQVTGLPQIVVKIHRDKAAQYGVSIEEINQSVNIAFAGQSAGIVYEGEKRFDLVVRLAKEFRTDITDVRSIFVQTRSGKQVPLELLADVDLVMGPNQIQREDAKRRIIVGLNVRGRDIAGVVADIQQSIDKNIKLPSGYFIRFGGQFENFEQAKERLTIAVPVALLLILIMLYFTFNNIIYSLLIFSAIPMSAIGGVFALWLRDMPFSISAGVGFIALFGVAVLNGIVLIAEFNRLKEMGLHTLGVIVRDGTQTRLRPVLMTAAVASLGFLPMALATSSGAEVQRPLATVVIGGLISSTALTLILLPCLYLIIEPFTQKSSRKKRAEEAFSALGIVLVCFFFQSSLCSAQNVESAASKRALTPDQAFEIARSKNFTLQKSKVEVLQNQTLIGTSSEIPKTSFTLQTGQYNQFFATDNQLSIRQTIPFPTVFSARSDVYEAMKEHSEIKLRNTEVEIRFAIASIFERYKFLLMTANLEKKTDSTFSVLCEVAKKQLESGEGTVLELSSAEAARAEHQTEMLRTSAERQALERDFSALLGGEQNVIPLVNEFEIIKNSKFTPSELLDEKILRNTLVSQNPSLRLLGASERIAEKERSLVQAEFLPEISLGYSTLTLNQTPLTFENQNLLASGNRASVLEFGLSFPIWFVPNSAKSEVEALKIQQISLEKSAQTEALLAEYNRVYVRAKSLVESLKLYSRSILPNSQKQRELAEIAFRKGEISYPEYLFHFRQALLSQKNVLQTEFDFAQTLLQLQFLSGEIQ